MSGAPSSSPSISSSGQPNGRRRNHISMFTAIVLSRMMLRWIVQQNWAKQAHLFGIDESELSVDARGRREVSAP